MSTREERLVQLVTEILTSKLVVMPPNAKSYFRGTLYNILKRPYRKTRKAGAA